MSPVDDANRVLAEEADNNRQRKSDFPLVERMAREAEVNRILGFNSLDPAMDVIGG